MITVMTKKIFLFLLLVFSLLIVDSGAVKANDGQLQREGNVVTVARDEAIDHDYLTTGGTVTMSGTVNGDLYAFGGTLTIDGVVNGDVIAAGGTVTITGEVKDDVRVAGGTVTINGKIDGNLLVGSGALNITRLSSIGGSVIAGSGTVEINAPISKIVWIGASQAQINSNIKADINVSAETLILGKEATVEGNLTYWSEREAQLYQGATVSGQIKREQPLVDTQAAPEIWGVALGFGLLLKLASTISLIVLGLLLLRYFPKQTLAASNQVARQPLVNLGWGVAAVIIVGFVIMLLCLSLVGLPLGLVLAALIIIEVYLSGLFVSLWLGRRLFKSLERDRRYAWALVIGIIIFQAISLLPFIGSLFKLLAILIGLGAWLKTKLTAYSDLRSKL